MQSKERRFSTRIAQVIVLIVAAIIVLYYLANFATQIPFNITLVIEIVVVGIVGYFAIGIVTNELRLIFTKTSGLERGATVATAFRYFGYIALAFVLLAIAGISGTALLAGGTFGGLILGLASQQTLSNIFAGLLILTARPFLVGERITLSTWQWGFALTSYPPKFFSDDMLIPGYTGVVQDIRLNFTAIRLDEGPLVRVPNSIVIQGAVVTHEIQERVVKIRYDMQKPIDIEGAINVLHDVVAKNEYVAKPESVVVNIENITPTNVIVAILVVCKGAHEAKPRSSILVEIEKAIASFKETQGKK